MSVLGDGPAWACSSCGCSLSSDWVTQGVSVGEGLRLDLRYDLLNQNQMRSGTRPAVSPGEQERMTVNRYLTAALDYNWNADWGVNVQLPYIHRQHATDGDPQAPAYSAADTRGIGDVKVLARYAGLADGTWGLQWGVKLPTGSYNRPFTAGEAIGTRLDRGLQPGTGTTDVLFGLYKLGLLSPQWDYFSQALLQAPLNARDDYKPGRSVNVNLGLRYLGWQGMIPQLQVNTRVSTRDSGSQATPNDSGGKTVYLSPGVTSPVHDRVKVYAFFQKPIHQNLNGFQLAPKYTVSVGARVEFE